MAKQNSKYSIVLVLFGWLVVGVVFMIFWELILTVAVTSFCCWFVWQFRIKLWNLIKTFVDKLKS